jgi:L-ribulokinase
MQTVSNVLNMPIKVAKNDQACALGSAMAASVAAEIHKDFATAQDAMGSGFEKEYYPDTKKANTYQILYQKYLKLGDLIEENFYSK